MIFFVQINQLTNRNEGIICSISHNSIVVSGGLISSDVVMAYRGHCITQNSFSLRYAHLALLIHIWHGWMVILPEENWKRLCAALQYVLSLDVPAGGRRFPLTGFIDICLQHFC